MRCHNNFNCEALLCIGTVYFNTYTDSLDYKVVRTQYTYTVYIQLNC